MTLPTLEELEDRAKAALLCGVHKFTVTGCPPVYGDYIREALPATILALIADLRACRDALSGSLEFIKACETDTFAEFSEWEKALQNLEKWSAK